MSLMFLRLRQISRVFPRIYSGDHFLQFREDFGLFAPHWNPLSHPSQNIRRSFTDRGCAIRRFSIASETSHELLPEDNLLSFIESTLNDLEGPCHCWMNKVEDVKDFHRRNGVFLVLFGAFLEEPLVPGNNSAAMFEKVKSLQQR